MRVRNDKDIEELNTSLQAALANVDNRHIAAGVVDGHDIRWSEQVDLAADQITDKLRIGWLSGMAPIHVSLLGGDACGPEDIWGAIDEVHAYFWHRCYEIPCVLVADHDIHPIVWNLNWDLKIPANNLDLSLSQEVVMTEINDWTETLPKEEPLWHLRQYVLGTVDLAIVTHAASKCNDPDCPMDHDTASALAPLVVPFAHKFGDMVSEQEIRDYINHDTIPHSYVT